MKSSSEMIIAVSIANEPKILASNSLSFLSLREIMRNGTKNVEVNNVRLKSFKAIYHCMGKDQTKLYE